MRCYCWFCSSCKWNNLSSKDSTRESMSSMAASTLPKVVPISWVRRATSQAACSAVAYSTVSASLAKPSTSALETANCSGSSIPLQACTVLLNSSDMYRPASAGRSAPCNGGIVAPTSLPTDSTSSYTSPMSCSRSMSIQTLQNHNDEQLQSSFSS